MKDLPAFLLVGLVVALIAIVYVMARYQENLEIVVDKQATKLGKLQKKYDEIILNAPPVQEPTPETETQT